MFTVQQLVARNVVVAWSPQGAALPMRFFYYTRPWEQELRALGPTYAWGRVTQRDVVEALVENYVKGTARIRIGCAYPNNVRPVFKRMNPPHHMVVEMRTRHTRTFGMFTGPNVFIACHLVPVAALKNPPPSTPDPYQLVAQRIHDSFMPYLLSSEIDGTTHVSALVTD